MTIVPHPAATVIRAEELVVGDVVRLAIGWRNVLDVWSDSGFVHAVASDATGMWEMGEEVEVSRRRGGRK